MITDHCKIHELTATRVNQNQSCPAPGRTESSGSFPGPEKPKTLSDNSEGNRPSPGSTAGPPMDLPTAGGTSAREAPAHGETPFTDEGAGATDRQSAEQGDVLVNENLKPKSGYAMRGGTAGVGQRESPDSKSAGAATESRPESGKKLSGDDDPYKVTRFWLENLVPAGDNQNLDYPPNISSFRHYPERFIGDMAEDPLEAMLMSTMRHFHGEVEYYIATAGDTRDPACRISFLNFVMRLSDQQIKISDALRRGRRDGRQEVIVKHQESDGGPVRRPRAHRFDQRENAAKVSKTKRSAAT